MTIEIELGGELFELETTDFSPPGRHRWGEPPETGEIELCPFVFRPERDVHMTLDEFVGLYAEYHRLDVRRAKERLEDECFEEAMRLLEERYDDRLL